MKYKVYLRALEPEDYLVSIKWRNDNEIWSMLGGPKYFVSQEYERQWVKNAIADNKNLILAICLLENDKYIGNVYLTNIDYINSCAKTHVLIGNKSYWGKGVAYRAYLQLIDFAFNERGLNRLESLILENNYGSIRLHEKIGYKKEGLLRNSVFKNGKYNNQLIFSLLKTDIDE